MGRTAIAIGCALVFSARCGGEVTSALQRATSDGGLDDAPSAAQGKGGDGSSDGISRVPDVQSDAALEAPRPDSAAALTGPAECAAAGGQCEMGAVSGLEQKLSTGPCGPAGAVCCLRVLCAADATVQLVQASDYRQSCTADSDCVEVYVGNACTCALTCRAEPAAINMGALPQYTADVAKLPRVFCGCPPPPPPCADETYRGPAQCVGGMCQFTPCPNE